jgi:hypothetical protein
MNLVQNCLCHPDRRVQRRALGRVYRPERDDVNWDVSCAVTGAGATTDKSEKQLFWLPL